VGAYLHCTLREAAPHTIDDELLPKLPQWFPLPPVDDDGNRLAPLDEAERTRQRRARALVEACTGPLDGRREQVRVDASGAPPSQIVLLDGRCIYVLSVDESNKHHAIYRYSPQLSLMHHAAMRAVEDGFNEYGQQYALEAAHDDTSAMGYAQR
jgi:hypothetical protein